METLCPVGGPPACLWHWTPLLTNTRIASPFTIIDSTASNHPARFYRAVQSP